MCLPGSTLTGMDSVKKKLDAVGRIAGAMGLTNVRLTTGRAEELGHDTEYREQFDIVTARAVAPINTLLEYCAPFVKKGGFVVLWKSLDIEQELKDSLLARAELSCHLIKQHTYSLGAEWGERQLLIFEKASALSKKYPRETGVPKKDPIGA
jgi:16S rRNA (guanine527-N7)-methyltransferase